MRFLAPLSILTHGVQEDTAEILFQHFSQTPEQLKARTVIVDQEQLECTHRLDLKEL